MRGEARERRCFGEVEEGEEGEIAVEVEEKEKDRG